MKHVIIDNRGFAERAARWIAVRIAWGIAIVVMLLVVAHAW
jgi:hypothetical protein